MKYEPMLVNPILICYCPICKKNVSPYTKNVQETEYKDVYGHVLKHHYEEYQTTI